MSVIDPRAQALDPATGLRVDVENGSATPTGETGSYPEPGWARYRACQIALIGSGLLVESACVLGGGVIAAHSDPGLIEGTSLRALTAAYFFLSVIATVGRHKASRRDGASWLIWLALLLGLVATRDDRQRDFEALAVWFGASCLCIFLVQNIVRRVETHLLGRILPCRPVAIIGNSESAARMLAQVRAARPTTVRVVGYFDDRLTRPGPLVGVIPCLGTVDDLVSYIHDKEIAEVYMALPWSAGSRISQLIERLRFLPMTVRLIPDQVPPALPGRGDGQIEGVVMPTLMVPPFSAVGAVIKRGLDVFLGGLLLIPMVPLFTLVAVLIRLDSRGPVFFRQVRSGQYGRPFRIFKFRTLHVQQADAAAETLVTTGDRRVTRVGRVLRKYSIDELPQLINVVLGHMSLVGPRPHAPRAKADGRIYAEVMPEYMLRYRVKPGMTGWAQVNGWRGNTDTEEQLRKRVEFDFQYIGGWSPLKDVEIMVRTIPAMLLPPAQNV
jgi:Undecaprenyl-phosphate glucose phosphotransferase